MIFTARQLQLLHQAGGRVVLPYRARLTPLAQDWLRQKKIAVGFSDAEYDASARRSGDASLVPATTSAVAVAPYAWWCEGACGTSKAALTAVAKESALQPMGVLGDASRVNVAIKHLAQEVKDAHAGGGVMIVKHAGAAAVLSNRNPALRAVVGTTLAAVEDGIGTMAANVLIIEQSQHTLVQLKNMISRFVKTVRQPSEKLEQELSEAASCGCKH